MSIHFINVSGGPILAPALRRPVHGRATFCPGPNPMCEDIHANV